MDKEEVRAVSSTTAQQPGSSARERKTRKGKEKQRHKKEKKRRKRESSRTSSSSLSSEDRKKRKKSRKDEDDPEQLQMQFMQHQVMQQQMMQQWQMQQHAAHYQHQVQQWQYAQHMQVQYQQHQAAHQQKMRQQQEDEKRRLEDLKKAEEQEKARLEEELRRKNALTAIMKALQNMRCATPESFEELKQKLNIIYAQELRHTKQDLQALVYEKEKALETARKNVEQIKIARSNAQTLAHAASVKKASFSGNGLLKPGANPLVRPFALAPAAIPKQTMMPQTLAPAFFKVPPPTPGQQAFSSASQLSGQPVKI